MKKNELTRRAFLVMTSTGFAAVAVGQTILAGLKEPKADLKNVASIGQEWSGKWIGYNPIVPRRLPPDGAESRLDWQEANWVWTGEAKAVTDSAPSGLRYFRWTLNLPDVIRIKSAWFQFAAGDSASLYVNGQKRSECQTWEKPIEREIRDFVRPGSNIFGVLATSNGGSAGWTLKLCIQTEDGKISEFTPVAEAVVWTDRKYLDEKWASLKWNPTGWHPASILGEVGIAPWGKIKPAGFLPGSNQPAPAPLLRRSFAVTKPVKQAVLRSSGLGCHEVYCNGVKVGDAVLDPAMTQYDKTVLYVQHDVTALLNPGQNALGVMLGHGWFAETARTTWNFDRAIWHDRPKLRLELRLEYADGAVETIVSDTSWKASLSPVLMDDFMNGEVYDARAEQPGWATAAFDDSTWKPAEIMSAPAALMSPQTIAPMRVTQTLTPVKVWETSPGVFIFDIGQNIAGWARIRVKGPAGREIRLRFGELLRDGRVDRELGGLIWSGWFQEDRYLLKGGDREEWEPRFTYHGFRYVEVEGWQGTPALSDLDGRVVHTDFPAAGSFECSNPLLNTIQQDVLWSYRGNFHGFPTDCPTREKKGWTGDAHLACEQAMLNWDNRTGYEKWMRDFADIQDEEGRLKTVIPSPGWGAEATDWNVAALLIPWYVYVYTGDLQILKSTYPMMKKWAAYHARQTSDYIQHDGVSDWCPAKTRTPAEITSTCYYYGGIVRLAKMASLLGKSKDAAAYRQEARAICDSFQKRFVKPDGTVSEGSQTAQACALYFGLVPRELQSIAAKKLSEAVTAANDHVDVGILGSKALFRMLSEYGYHAQAYRVVTQKTAPGYGWMIQRGCTCLTEDWYGGGSQNHVMFGDISAWFYEYLAGIQADPDIPGFKHFFLCPQPTGELTWVRAEHRSPFGLIKASWEKQPTGGYKARFTVPSGSKATIALPDGHRSEMMPGEATFSWRAVQK